MDFPLVVAVIVATFVIVLLALSIRVVKQYERGVLFRLGRVTGVARSRASPSSSRWSTCSRRCRCAP